MKLLALLSSPLSPAPNWWPTPTVPSPQPRPQRSSLLRLLTLPPRVSPQLPPSLQLSAMLVPTLATHTPLATNTPLASHTPLDSEASLPTPTAPSSQSTSQLSTLPRSSTP